MSIKITPAPAHQRPSGKLYLSTDQLNLVNNTWTKVALDTIAAGFSDGIEDTVNNRITPGYAGFYDLKGLVTFVNIVAARNYRAAIKISNTTWHSVKYSWAGGGTYLGVPVGDLVKLTATDYVELLVMSQSGDNTVDIASLERLTFLSVQRVR